MINTVQHNINTKRSVLAKHIFSKSQYKYNFTIKSSIYTSIYLYKYICNCTCLSAFERGTKNYALSQMKTRSTRDKNLILFVRRARVLCYIIGVVVVREKLNKSNEYKRETVES